MRIDKFEELVTHKKMRIERRVKAGDREIFVAEGYCSGDRDDLKPHYKTMYAIAYDPENLTVGEFFTTPIIFPMKSKEDRLSLAEERAKEFLANMVAECPN